MSLSYAALERLSQKKFFSKPAPQPATISTINIGVEDFLSPHSSEDAGHYSSSQRPPRRTGGSVHFNMPAASKVSPRHTVQNNKTIPASKAGNGNGPARDSSAVLSSIASRGKKSGMGGALLKPLQRDITASEAQSRQATPIRGKKQRPSTAEASGEKPSEGMGNVFQRHSSCELRDHAEEDLQSPLSQKISFSRSSPDPLQIPSRQEINNEFGMSMRDMSESLSKIEELIFPSKAGQEVVMRENMAFEASPILSSGFLELEDGSMKPLYVSPFARSQSRNSDGDLERAEDAIVNGVRKQRRAQSAVKWRRRNDRSMPCHEKSPSCDNETTFREKVNRRWTLVRSSAEFLSSSLPLYGDRSDSGSGASTEEEGDVSSTRRRWPKIPQCFSYSTIRGNSASKSESSFFGTESPTTQVETEPDAVAEHSDTSGRRICRSMIEMGKSRRSRLEDSNLACDRTTTGHESVANAESGEENNLKHHDVLNEKQNEGFEEENEVLCKDGYTGIDGGNGGCMAHEPAKKRDGSSSEHSTPRKDTMVIVLPTSSVSNGQSTKQTITQAEQRATQQHSESMQVLFPTKEAQEQRKDQLSNSVRISADASQQEMNHHEEDQDGAEVRSLSDVDVSRSSPHTKNQIHCQSSEEVLTHKHLSFYFEDSSTISESADEKHVDVDSSGAQHQDDLELEQPVSRDVFDVRCEKNRSSSGFFNVCAQKSTDAQDKAPIATIQQSNTEEKYIHASLSTEKLCSILSYLGQVEQSNLQENLGIPTEKGTPLGACFYSLSGNGSPRAVLEHAEDAVSLTSSSQTAHSGTFHLSGDVGGDSRVADCNPPAIAATTVFDGVRKKVQELKQKIAEQEAKIAQLQAENKKLVREREEHMLFRAREKYHKQLEHQAAEYKVIIQHHLSVNEKMLRDKEQLSEKCCNLAGILSVAESKFDEKVKQLSEQWSREMKKAKELWAVGEKQRMKIWQEKKIKDLKETAIRGLEPHIDNLNDVSLKQISISA
ncbi:hypothetical protein KC19_VG265200 [Ceratodon purpureus]|uniref:Uncharacterized protein n=1 Tax=Ceratodon purpureus TaxID=3225 RepID=A0A8T0HUR2_CERPU|nr:hypothetical protein KC19_VG265200 [Ceratodon purpureus]KAG0574479.1 hypothetical protein KC19_VG265200 [Ceratodon purpureus]